MKKAAILMMGLWVLACQPTPKGKPNASNNLPGPAAQNQNFDWLTGHWKRVNEAPGKETFENWVKLSDTAYTGIGLTLQNGDTLQHEIMQLTKTNDTWNLAVQVGDDPAVTTFTGTQHHANGFTCENPQNDFPNVIQYWHQNGKLLATISNASLKISFEFECVKE